MWNWKPLHVPQKWGENANLAMDKSIYSYNNIPEWWCTNSGQNWIERQIQSIQLLILKKKKEISLLFYFGFPLFVFPKAFYIYTFHSSNLVLSIVYSQPLISDVVLKWWINKCKGILTFNSIQCLQQQVFGSEILSNNSKIQIRLNLKQICKKLILHVLLLYFMLYIHKNSKTKLQWSTSRNTMRPCLQVTVLSSTIIIIIYITQIQLLHQKLPKVLQYTCFKAQVHTASFLSTKWVVAFHNKGKKSCKIDCNCIGVEGNTQKCHCEK